MKATGGRGGKEALADKPVILRSLFGTDTACDYPSLRNLVFCKKPTL